MKYYSSKKVTEILGVTAQTLRNWDKEGKLKPSYVKSNGYRYYPSSKTCNKCNYKKENLKLSDRTFVCPNCGLVLNRDNNAVTNIKICPRKLGHI